MLVFLNLDTKNKPDFFCRSFEFLGGKAKWNGVEKYFVLTSFAVRDHFVKRQLIQQDKLGNHYYDL